MSIKKPQSPMKLNGDYFYPMTADSQVVMENGKRLNTLLKENIIYYNDEEATDVEIGFIDADLLGGKPAEDYVLKENIGEIEGGGGDITVNLNGAEQSGQPSTVNADLLGGIAAENYVQKNEIGMDLLWENESPTSGFAAQTITISGLSNYKTLVFLCKHSSYNNDGFNSWVYPTYVPYLEITMGISARAHVRKITLSGDNITFTTGYSDSTTTNDHTCAPLYIYGIK